MEIKHNNLRVFGPDEAKAASKAAKVAASNGDHFSQLPDGGWLHLPGHKARKVEVEKTVFTAKPVILEKLKVMDVMPEEVLHTMVFFLLVNRAMDFLEITTKLAVARIMATASLTIFSIYSAYFAAVLIAWLVFA